MAVNHKEGACACGKVRYELHGSPMIVHACHCTACRHMGGGPFAVNICIEADNVVVTSGELRTVRLNSGESGQPCETWFCGDCGTALWNRYHVSPANCRYVRASTLNDPASITPDVHIWTQSKMPWIELPGDVPSFEQFYDPKTIWTPENLERLHRNMEE